MDQQKVLTDLFYQLTDFTRDDVKWINLQGSVFDNEPDFAILRVCLKDDRQYSVMNQFGTVHIVEV